MSWCTLKRTLALLDSESLLMEGKRLQKKTLSSVGGGGGFERSETTDSSPLSKSMSVYFATQHDPQHTRALGGDIGHTHAC